MKINYLLVGIILLFSACKKINPDKPSYKGDPIHLPSAVSSINLPLDIPLSYLEDNLNRELKDKLFDEKGLDLGSGLSADLQVIKTGKVSLFSTSNGKLRIKLPIYLDGSVQIEKKIFGQSISTSVPFNENLIPEISFIPVISDNWSLLFKDLEIENWGKPLRYNFLGFDLDLDPIIRGQIQKVMRRQFSENGMSVLNLKALAEQTWRTVEKPFQVQHAGLVSYWYTVPQKLKLNQELTADQHLRLTLGIEGEVFSRVGSAPNIKPSPLPEILPNNNPDNSIDIMLPLSISYKEIDRFINNAFQNQAFVMDKTTKLIPHSFETQNFGDRILVDMKFTAEREKKKDLQGNIYLVGKPTYDPVKQAIVFEQIDFDINTKNFLANSANWLRQNQVLAQIKKYAEYPIGDYLDEARESLKQQVNLNSDFASIELLEPTLDIKDIYTTEEDIKVYLNSTGKIGVTLKSQKDKAVEKHKLPQNNAEVI